MSAERGGSAAPGQDTAVPASVDSSDTIAALATPPGTSGIAVVRVSGPDALSVVGGVFRGADLRTVAGHTAHHGWLVDNHAEVIDEVLVTVFRSPASYTGEDAVEIGCHGGPAVSRAVLDCLYAAGVRPADPGEFTRRAFINGRMDLAQAEAVADMIHARSRDAHRASIRQLQGALSRRVHALRDRMIRCASLLELSLDFAEEDVELLGRDELRTEVRAVHTDVEHLANGYRNGRIIRDGLAVVLVGRPNAGKSSLLNALLGSARAIVTDIPGTTRDSIEEQVLLQGALLRLIDTAGLRGSDETVERLGIERTRAAIQDADVLVCVVDADDAAHPAATVSALLQEIDALRHPGSRVCIAWNKCDLPGARHVPDRGLQDIAVHVVSAVNGEGLDGLGHFLADATRDAARATEQGEALVTNVRHLDCLRRCAHALERADMAITSGRTEEILALELRTAIDSVGEIIGAIGAEDILSAIFSRFCIGK